MTNDSLINYYRQVTKVIKENKNIILRDRDKINTSVVKDVNVSVINDNNKDINVIKVNNNINLINKNIGRIKVPKNVNVVQKDTNGIVINTEKENAYINVKGCHKRAVNVVIN